MIWYTKSLNLFENTVIEQVYYTGRVMKKRAVISVSDKSGIADLCTFLCERDWEIISTGGTASFLAERGIAVTDISAVTDFPECLDGRVKTLHPAVHAGLLARRDSAAHMDTIRGLNIRPIDLVCVNLYPFFEKVRAGLSFDDTIEFIDIGGPSMLRSAAKNFKDVIVLTDPADYTTVQEALALGDADCTLRRMLAAKVFNLTAAYDAAIARFMFESSVQTESGAKSDEKNADVFPLYHTVPLVKKQELRYGENAHQKAALYIEADRTGSFADMEQLQGKELSYNNMRDLDAAWKAVGAYKRYAESDAVFVVALKHNTPCGAAADTSVLGAYQKAFACDPVSIFGGILGCSHTVDVSAAQKMCECFLEVIAAPDFTADALRVFSAKKNLRLIRMKRDVLPFYESISVDGGLLVQSADTGLFDSWKVVTEAAPEASCKADALFGMTVALSAKSNAIVVVKDAAAVGIGCGQTNRIWAAEQALSRAKAVTDKAGSAPAELLISDAFFPFSDCVEKAAEYGIKTIIQPGGSIRDEESIAAANRLGIAMVFTGRRHFKH